MPGFFLSFVRLSMKTIHTLNTILSTPEIHQAFVDSIVNHMETEIQSLSMIKGLFIKKTYAAVKSVRPGYIRHIIEVLSKDYIAEFSEMHEAFRASQKLPAENITPFIDYIHAHQKEADAHFWRIADDYAAKRSESFIGKAYKAGRSSIASHLPLIYKIICTEIDHHTIVEV